MKPLDRLVVLCAFAALLACMVRLSLYPLAHEQTPQQLRTYQIDLNKADVPMLAVLPGIGPRLAQRIVDYRQEHGPFVSAQALVSVSGIGEVKLEQMLPYVRVQ